MTISWCGDSRAYIFNEKSGIRLISQDHSYVQELVNKGLLTYDQTFDHPQNNIITRSLGDPTKEARPESKTLKVGKGDIILLCSDGLSGVLRDRKTYDSNGQLLPEENIEDIIRANTSSMKECREALWLAAERAGWYDNVTAILCQITDGPESQWATSLLGNTTTHSSKSTKKTWLFLCIAILVIAAMAASFYLGKNSKPEANPDLPLKDSIISEVADPIILKDSTTMETEKATIKTTEESEKAVEKKTTVQEQIKKQAEDKVDTITRPNGLTKIEKKGDNENKTETKKNNELTLIKDKIKKNQSDKPLVPNNPKKDNITENPLNNQ